MGSAELEAAVELGRQAIVVAIKLSLPVLLAGLLVGAVISLLQAATQIQEQTLAAVPKMFAIAATLFLLMPWLMAVLAEYARNLVYDMAFWFR